MILFNPMAPERAPTMAMVIQRTWLKEGIPEAAISAEVKANGRAKIEWENLIILR
jgi:hypothetical protein